jgi:hypothetical protein
MTKSRKARLAGHVLCLPEQRITGTARSVPTGTAGHVLCLPEQRITGRARSVPTRTENYWQVTSCAYQNGELLAGHVLCLPEQRITGWARSVPTRTKNYCKMSVGNHQRKIQLGRLKRRWFKIIVAVTRSRTDSRGVDVTFAAGVIDLAQLQSGHFGSETHAAPYVEGNRYCFT